ncbi:MAG TPA: ABC transporter permease [Candidatus Thermoplasmatota archaeon]|nr:ABC transporter permease [Candidatus Thermoplasmatota archaeon]
MADITLTKGYRDAAPVPRGYLQAGRFNFRMAWAVWRREVTVYRRIWPSTILSNLFDPIIYLLAIGFGLGAFLESFEVEGVGAVTYLEFIAPGLLASSIMMAAAYEMAWNTYVRIHQERIFEAMLATPATASDVVAGELFWATTRSLIYSVVLLVVYLSFEVAGYTLLRFSPLLLLVPFAAVLGGLFFSVVGMSYTGLVNNIEYLTFYFTLFLTPQFLFSGIFFPLPEWAAPIAWFIPLTHVVELCRGLLLDQGLLAVWDDAAWLVVATLVLWPVPHLILRRKLLK